MHRLLCFAETSLSLHFEKEIESGRIFNKNDIDFKPTLQIIDMSTKFRKFILNSTDYTQKEVSLQVADKNGCYLKVKITSQLNDVTGNLTSGSIIEIKIFQVLKHS